MPPVRLRRGFTLIELLAVVAIVGVLISLVFVSIGSMRDSARKSECGSNLRQVGVAMQAYAADNGRTLPPTYVVGVNTGDNNWWYAVIPYLGYPPRATGTDLWAYVQVCSARGPLHCGETDFADASMFSSNRWVSYKMNQRYRTVGVGSGSGIRKGTHYSRIPNPAMSLMVSEGRQTTEFSTWQDETQSPANGLIYPHRGAANALFADGHVETIPKAVMLERWAKIYTDSIAQ